MTEMDTVSYTHLDVYKRQTSVNLDWNARLTGDIRMNKAVRQRCPDVFEYGRRKWLTQEYYFVATSDEFPALR